MAGSQVLAHQTRATATGFGAMVLWSPITVGRWIVTLPGRMWFFLRTRSKLQLLAGVVVLAVGLAGVGWPMYAIVKERRRDILRKEQDRQLELHFVRGSMDGVKHNLSALKNVSPNDVIVTKRLAALESGTSDPNDFKMARLLMRDHYSHGRLADACREAESYLAFNTNDWEALVILADSALRQGDHQRAARYASRLPAPRDLPPWTCLVGARVFRDLGEQDRLAQLLDYIADDQVPVIRPAILSGAEPQQKLSMVELYNLALARIAERPKLKSSWVPVQEICHSIASAKESSPQVLTRLGICQEQHLEDFLRRFVELRVITADEYNQFAKEIEDRLTLIWDRVRTADPASSIPFIGMAMQKARAGRMVESINTIDDGIRVCGSSPELVERRADLLRRSDPAASLAYLESEHDKQPASLNMCRIIAQAALAARRPDRALEAMKKAHSLHPNLPWVCQLEAQALMQAGRPTEAAGALRRVLPQISRDLNGIVMYVQSLAASGAVSTAEQFLHETLVVDPTTPAVAVGADALARLGHLDAAVKVLRQVIDKQRDNSFAHVLLADCLRQIAENKPNAWDQELIREAIKSYRLALDRYPKNLQLTNNIAWLQLVALNLRREALETISPMRDMPDLPAAILETIGAVLVANGSYDAGRAALERSIQFGGERATTLAFLADAYRGLNRSNDSLLALRKALSLPKTNPRDAELIAEIRQRIERASP